ncbi:hypothetical protein ACFYST_06105 [Kitasatospora sp. NPDC004614]|uniref:hypothetical protein n=1 Tax=unclassified Kitasatospora TaxID=2633591 RepID=UPI0036745A87
MREIATTVLDVLGLLLLALGAGAALFGLIGWSAAAVSGGVILAGSWVAARPGQRPGGEQ